MKQVLAMLCACAIIVMSLTALDRTIQVSGEAEIRVVPDEVVITVAIETSNLDLIKSKQENDTKTKQVISVLKKAGIEDKYIKTDFITIEPRYQTYPKQEFLGFFVIKRLVVTLKDLTKFEKLTTDILIGGVNYIHNITFRTTELRKHRDTARQMAIRAAKEKAIALTQELGMKLGKPISINENQSNYWYGYMRNEQRHMTQNAMIDTGSGAPSEDGFAPGMITVTANVSVLFQME